MSYFKAFILAVIVAVFTIFILQNIDPLNQTIQLRLNLYLLQHDFPPLAVHLLTAITFFLGLLLASLIGLSVRFRMRRALRKTQQEIQTLNNELQSLRNLPLNDKSLRGNETAALEERLTN